MPSPNHGTLSLPNDDDDDVIFPRHVSTCVTVRSFPLPGTLKYLLSQEIKSLCTRRKETQTSVLFVPVS